MTAEEVQDWEPEMTRRVEDAWGFSVSEIGQDAVKALLQKLNRWGVPSVSWRQRMGKNDCIMLAHGSGKRLYVRGWKGTVNGRD